MNRIATLIFCFSGAIGFGGAAFFAGRAYAGGIPTSGTLTYSGLLQDASGTPLTGTQSVEVKFWCLPPTCASETLLCDSGTPSAKALEAGHFSISLPDACTTAIKDNKDVWAEVFVGPSATTTASLGRVKLGAVPYAIEAEHAVSADTAASAAAASSAASADTAASAASAASATGTLLATITQMQADISALKNNYGVGWAYTANGTVVTDSTAWVWLGGAPAIEVAAGETVFVWNTSQTWAVNSNNGTSGCTGCSSGTVRLSGCYRVGSGTPTASDSSPIIVDVAPLSLGSESSANNYFQFTSATANIAFGLCARRYDASTTRWDVKVANIFTMVQSHKS